MVFPHGNQDRSLPVQVPVYVQVAPCEAHWGAEIEPEYPVPQESVPAVPTAPVVVVPPVVTIWVDTAGRRQVAAATKTIGMQSVDSQ